MAQSVEHHLGKDKQQPNEGASLSQKMDAKT